MSCYWAFILLCNVVVQAHFLPESPVDMVVAENVYVLTTNGVIYTFNQNLSFLSETTLQISSSRKLRSSALKMAITDDEKELIVCFANGECFLFDTMEFFADLVSASFDSSTSAVLSSIEMNTFYIAHQTNDLTSGFRFIQLNRYAITTSQYNEDAYDREDQYFVPSDVHRMHSSSLEISNTLFISRTFSNTFRQSSYVYFLGLDEFNNSTLGIFLMRGCDERTVSGYDVYEMYLFCGSLSQGTSIIGMFVSDSTIFVDIHQKHYSYTKQCAFNITEINYAMDSAYGLCTKKNYDNPIRWASPSRHNCNKISQRAISRCNFGSPNEGNGNVLPAIAVSSFAHGQVTMELWNYFTNISLTLSSRSTVFTYLGASNSTGHYMLKYFHNASGHPTLVKEYSYSHPVQILKQNKDAIYVATTTDIFRYRIFSVCSQYNSCASCTALKDPLCGWCTVENKCSTAEHCYSHELTGRWINSDEKCIVSVSLSNIYAAFDNLSHVSFNTQPFTSVFPRLTSNESFSCVFTSLDRATKFNLSVVDGSCVNGNINFVMQNTSFIKLSFKVLSDSNHPSVVFPSNSQLTVFNCSKYTRCLSCQHTPGCGWCVYDHKCTGNRSTCREPSDWRTPSQQHVNTCPVLLKPLVGRYLQPVGVNKSLLLSTKHLPPPMAGCKYICRVKILGDVLFEIDVETSYIHDASSMNVSCLFQAKQTMVLLQVSSGIRSAHLSLLYVNAHDTKKKVIELDMNNDNDDMYQMDTIGNSSSMEQLDMVLYDCGQLASSCSACMSLRLRPENFSCGWCTSSSCTIREECDGIYFIQNLSGQFCPSPKIETVHPLSGPIQGGTVVTIVGSDLGSDVSSIGDIMFGEHRCTIIPSEYQPGRLIRCITPPAMVQSGAVIVQIIVKRGESGNFSAIHRYKFKFLNPIVTDIFPRFGPIGGGTLVSVKGSSLDIGNDDSTTITLAGKECLIRSQLSNKITCVTSPNYPGEGVAHISFDSANIINGSFSYLPNPFIQSVSPAFIIQSGGITLTFTGTSLNSTVNPRLVIFEHQVEHIGSCSGVSSTTLECISPAIVSQYIKQKFSEHSRQTLNYTLIMDNIPRLDITNPVLAVHVLSDPVFTEIEKSDRHYIRGSQEFISIIGENISHVQLSEISILVDNIPCSSIIQSQNVLQCKPPPSLGSSTQTYHALVKVKVGNGTLEYIAGVLEYVQDTSSNDISEQVAIVMGSLVGLIIILLLASMLGVCGFIFRKKCSKSVEEAPTPGSVTGTHQEMVPAEYDYVSHENVYEDINEITVDNGRELQGNGMKNEGYQTFSRPDRQVPNEDYIQMEAHSLFQPEPIVQLPRVKTAVAHSNQKRNSCKNNPSRQDSVRRGDDFRHPLQEQSAVSTERSSSLVTSGDYVAMLPPSTGTSQTCNDPAEHSNGETSVRPMVSASIEDKNAENDIQLTKLRCSSDV